MQVFVTGGIGYDFHFAVTAIGLRVAGLVADGVLVAYVAGHCLADLIHFIQVLGEEGVDFGASVADSCLQIEDGEARLAWTRETGTSEDFDM